jgi:hypothetical protein
LASQPTLSRFENQINIASLKRLRQVFVEQFLCVSTSTRKPVPSPSSSPERLE